MKQTFDEVLAATGISRRHLLRLLGIAGGGVATGAFSKVALAASGLSQTFDVAVHQGAGDRPEIVIGVTGLPPVLDPGQGGGSSIVGSRVTPIFHAPLFDVDFRDSDPMGLGNTVIPNIAASWTRIDDLTLEIKLRDDVLFHDGSKLTADDVKFTIDRVNDANSDPKLATMKVAYSSYAQVDIIDPLTLHLATHTPDAVLDQRLANLYVVSKAAVERLGIDGYALTPVGAGPYHVTDFVANDQITLESFDDYFGGLPPFSKVTIRAIPEVATRMAAILSNEIQLVTDVTPDQIAALQADDSLRVDSIATSNAHFYFYNTNNPLLNKQLRQGLNLAVDRQLLIDSLWLGNAELMHGYQVPEWGPMYNPARALPAYDPDKAKELIAASGYNGEEIVFRAPAAYYTLGADAAQAVVAMWQDIGVNARADLVDTAALLQNPDSLMVCFLSAGLNPNDPTTTFSNLWSPNALITATYWNPPTAEFYDTLAILTQTLDMQARYDAYQKVLDIWEDEAPASLLYRVNSIYGQKATVGWQPYTTFAMDLRGGNITPGV